MKSIREGGRGFVKKGDFGPVLTDIRNIQTSTGDISSHQRLYFSIPKLLQSSLTLCLGLVGVQGSRGPTTLLHHLHNNIGSTLLIDEDDLYFVSAVHVIKGGLTIGAANPPLRRMSMSRAFFFSSEAMNSTIC
jgi:hypothetical protein